MTTLLEAGADLEARDMYPAPDPAALGCKEGRCRDRYRPAEGRGRSRGADREWRNPAALGCVPQSAMPEPLPPPC